MVHLRNDLRSSFAPLPLGGATSDIVSTAYGSRCPETIDRLGRPTAIPSVTSHGATSGVRTIRRARSHIGRRQNLAYAVSRQTDEPSRTDRQFYREEERSVVGGARPNLFATYIACTLASRDLPVNAALVNSVGVRVKRAT